MKQKTTALCVALFTAIGLTLSSADKLYSSDKIHPADKKENPYYSFDEKGNLLRPKNYRSWIFAGTVTTPTTLDSSNLFPDFQNIYIDPKSFEFWKEKGHYPEGAILVKELIYTTDRTKIPIGTGYVQGKAYSIAVTIKDSKKFPDVPGGWEYFEFNEKKDGFYDKSAMAVGHKNQCIACHSRAEQGYGPFTELYAPLRDAQGVGKENPENLDNRSQLPSNQLKRN